MQPRTVEWVVKISKLCNLRCKYCYEFPYLGDRQRMGLDDLSQMFQHIAAYYSGSRKRMDFVWHGGEPLLVEPEYYRQIEKRQHEAFDCEGVPFTNSVQTNLTTLNAATLDFLKSGFFGNIGVSCDVFGEQRVDVGGHGMNEKVLGNMQLLRENGLSFGCIVVLSRKTAPYIREIYRFFEEIDCSFRLLPIYRTGFLHQQDDLALSPGEIVRIFETAVDLWMASSKNIQVRPIADYISNVVNKLDNPLRSRYYDKLKDEVVYIVNTDGSLYSVADPPDPQLCHGNLFTHSLTDLKQSAGYLRAVTAAAARMNECCKDCSFHGVCSGYFMAEATPEQRHLDNGGRLTCSVVKPVQRYIEDLLLSTGTFLQGEGFRAPAVSSIPDSFEG